MKRTILSAAAFILTLFLVGCGSGRSDPTSGNENLTSYGGLLTLGSGRANTPVSTANQWPVAQILNSELYGLCKRALAGIASSPQTVEDTLIITRISGRYSGYAEILGNRKLRTSNPEYVDYSFSMTLYDFSDSGFVFMGGVPMASGYIQNQGGILTKYYVYMKGGLAFAGNYAGAVEYNTMRLAIDSNNLITSVYASIPELRYYKSEGSQTFKYGGVQVARFNPYYRMDIGG